MPYNDVFVYCSCTTILHKLFAMPDFQRDSQFNFENETTGNCHVLSLVPISTSNRSDVYENTKLGCAPKQKPHPVSNLNPICLGSFDPSIIVLYNRKRQFSG